MNTCSFTCTSQHPSSNNARLEATEEPWGGWGCRSIRISPHFYSYQISAVHKSDKLLAFTSVNMDFHYSVLSRCPASPTSQDKKKLLVLALLAAVFGRIFPVWSAICSSLWSVTYNIPQRKDIILLFSLNFSNGLLQTGFGFGCCPPAPRSSPARPMVAALEDASKAARSPLPRSCKTSNARSMEAHKHFHLLSRILAQIQSFKLSYSL